MLHPILAAGLAAAVLSLSSPAWAENHPPDLSKATKGFLPCAEPMTPQSPVYERSYTQCLKRGEDLIGAVRQRLADFEKTPPTGGCIGQDEATCIAMLAQQLVATSTDGGEEFKSQTAEQSIDGVALIRIRIFDVLTPGGASHVTLTIAPDGTVSGVSASLPDTPSVAITAADYDATGVYDLTVALMGTACIGQDRLAFYRLVRDLFTYSSITTDKHQNLWIGRKRICGQQFSVSSWWSDPDARHPRDSGAAISVARPPTLGQSLLRFMEEHPLEPPPEHDRNHRRR